MHDHLASDDAPGSPPPPVPSWPGGQRRPPDIPGRALVRSLRPPRPAVGGIAALRRRPLRRGDLVGGLSIAAYLVPQCMAYARLAGLDPVTGLWAAVVPLILYSFFGTSSRLSVGPESGTALLVGSAIVTFAPADRAAAAAALALAVAAVAFFAWLARFGFLADLLSRPVLVGFMAGVAAVMVVGQLPNLTGIRTARRDTLGRLAEVASEIGHARPAPLLLGTGIIAVLVVLRRFRQFPGTLVAVLAAAVVTGGLGLERFGVATVGSVPGGLPALAWPALPAAAWPAVLVAALGISVVAYSDNVLTARAFAARSGDHIDANQELLALAVTNAGAGLTSGFPVSSSGSRAALGESAGAQSQWASLVAAAAVVSVLLAAGPLLAGFPLAALGALVVVAAWQLVDVPEMRRLAAFRTAEAALAATAFAGVIAFDVLAGIGIAVALSVLELFARVARAHDAVQGRVPGLAGLHDVDDYPQAHTIPGLVVYRYDAPLCFANAEDFRARLLAAVDAEAHPVEWVLVNMEASVEVDLTACDMLEQLRAGLAERNIVLAMARVKNDLYVYLERCGLAGRIGAERIYPTLPVALDAYRALRPCA